VRHDFTRACERESTLHLPDEQHD